MLKDVNIDDILPGMFIAQVNEQTGQLKIKTKGLVKTHKAIEELKLNGVIQVTVDLSRSELGDNTAVQPAVSVNPKSKKTKLSEGEMLTHATKLYDEAVSIQGKFFKRLEAKQNPSLDDAKQLSKKIIDVVFDMPSAISCLSLLNKTSQYLLEHSINCAILMTLFGRHKDLPRETIESLSLAGLLMDVGMVNMPTSITDSPLKLTEQQKEIVSTHVDISLDLVERCGEVSEIVQDVIFNHHERIDGSGYPDKQSGVDVSLYARMAAIVDTYDAMTTNRQFQSAVPPTGALRSLLTDKSYDPVLVQEFVQCMGVHPVGSLVKLTNSRLAIVIKSNKTNPLMPVVASFYHVNTGHYSEVKKIDLAHSELQIESSVRPEEFDINLTKFFREVLISAI